MSPQVQRTPPPYMQIVQHYRELIGSGELSDGDRLPATRRLTEEWGVAHATAAKVIATLRAEGLVETTRAGTVVRVQTVGQSPRDRLLAGLRWGRIYPAGEHARVVAAELVDAPEDVAQALGVEPGSSVIRRHRITFRASTPVSTSTSWFGGELAEAAPALLAAERIVQGTPRYVEERTGRAARHGRDQFTAGLAEPQVAADLQIPEGSPVLIGRNWFRDGDYEVIEFGQYVSTVGRWQTYEYAFD